MGRLHRSRLTFIAGKHRGCLAWSTLLLVGAALFVTFSISSQQRTANKRRTRHEDELKDLRAMEQPWLTSLGGEELLIQGDQWYANWTEAMTKPANSEDFSPYRSPDENGFVYCPIPGNGREAQVRLLQRLQEGGMQKGSDGYREGPSPMTLKDLPNDWALQDLLDGAVLKFVVVQNPLMRALNTFLESRDFKMDFATYVKRNFDGKRNLDDKKYCDAFREEQYRPQVCFCSLDHAPRVFEKFTVEHPDLLISALAERVPRSTLATGWGKTGSKSLQEFISFDQSGADDVFLNYFDLNSFEVLTEALDHDTAAFGYGAEIRRLRKLLEKRVNHPTEFRTGEPFGTNQVAFSRQDWFESWIDSFPTKGWESVPYVIRPKPRESKTLMYCGIAKNGCSQQKYLMLLLLGKEDMPIHDRPNADPYLRITDLSVSNGVQVVFDSSIPKFVIVRNPILRVLSGFRDKVEDTDVLWFDHKHAHNFSAFVFNQFGGKSLEEETYCSTVGSVDQHWRPQICSCGFRQAPYLYRRFRFEDSMPLVDFLYEHLPSRVLETGWGTGQNLSLRTNFREADVSRSAIEDQLFLKYYNRATFEFAVEVLARDISFFGYQEEVNRLRQLLDQQTTDLLT